MVIYYRLRNSLLMTAIFFSAVFHMEVVNAEVVDEVAIQNCLAQEDDTAFIWTPGAWENRFGERQNAVAKTRLVPELEFGFHHFSSREDADPLLLIIGHSAVMLQWDPLILSQLKKCFDVYLIDNYGVGRSKLSEDEETESELLTKLEWKDLGDFISQAVDGIKQSNHCKEHNCNITKKEPHLMGWAMGGKIAAEAASLNTKAFGKIVNLGGNIANNQGATGPNPIVVESLESSSFRQAQNAFYVNASSWGLDKAFDARMAVSGTGARAALTFFAWRNREGRASQLQKMEQARVSLTSNTELSTIENEVFITWGEQDDLNFCYPASGVRYQEVCVTGHLCADGIDCQQKKSRPMCGSWDWSLASMFDFDDRFLGFKNEDGCYWGIAPLDDYYWGRKKLTSSTRVCAKGFQGAHGFPAQSRDEMIAAVVDFVYQVEKPEIAKGLDCRSPKFITAK